MRWFKRQTRPKPAPKPDSQMPGPYAAYWWRPGCTCHWSAGVDMDYCDFCKCPPLVNSPAVSSCSCPDPLREVSAFCSVHGHSPDLRTPPSHTGDTT